MIEIPIRVKSSNKELRSALFNRGEEIEFSEEASLIYDGTDAEFGGFESEIVIEMTAAISSTEAVQHVSRYLYDQLEDIDSVEVLIKGKKAEISEEKLRRKLLSAYYKN